MPPPAPRRRAPAGEAPPGSDSCPEPAFLRFLGARAPPVARCRLLLLEASVSRDGLMASYGAVWRERGAC